MDSMDNSRVVYCYMVAYKCCVNLRRRTDSNVKCYDGQYIGRNFLDLPFQIKTKQDVLNAEKVLLDQLPDDANVENLVILGFQPIIPAPNKEE